jgi:hypothetical protein
MVEPGGRGRERVGRLPWRSGVRMYWRSTWWVKGEGRGEGREKRG